MKLFILCLSFVSFSQITFADVTEDLGFVKTGLRQAPIVQCPRPQKKYQDMLGQLSELKAKIKSEACNDKAISAINSQVSDLEKLIVGGRTDFVDLIKKGTSLDQQLSTKEVESLQIYIDSVVKKVASVAGLLKNEACFDDNTKISTLSFLSSLIGEVSGAIGALTGPFGAKISLGGKLASSLLGSIDSIVQARKTYDYSQFEDQKNYLNNLCAYYDFKSDLDKETSVFEYYDRVYLLQEVSTKLLSRLSEECSDCREAIDNYNDMKESADNFVVERRGVADNLIFPDSSDGSFFGAKGQKMSDAVEAVVSDDLSVESVTASDVTFRELADILYQQTDGTSSNSVLAEPVTVGAELVPDDESVEFNSREMTIRALQAGSWAEAEIDTLEQNDAEGLTDDGRREVMRVQKQLEDFLVDREAVNYIKYYSDLLLKDFRKINGVVSDISSQFYFWEVKKDTKFDYNKVKNHTVVAINDLFRSDLDFAIVISQYYTTEEYNAYINASKRIVLEALEPLRVDYGILSKRCQFFSKSLFKNKQSTQYACERMETRRKEIKEFFVSLQQTSFSIRYSRFLSFVNESNDNEVEDWLASVTKTFSMNLEAL